MPEQPTAPALRRPLPGEEFIHLSAHTMFHVTTVADQPGDTVVYYSRFGDGKSFKLTLPTFWEKFRPLTPEETAALERAKTHLIAGVIPASAETVRDINSQLDRQPAPGETGPQVSLPAPPPPRRGRRADQLPSEETAEVGELIEPNPAINNFDRLILYPETSSAIYAGLRSIARQQDMEEVWHLSAIMSVVGRALLFYGPSGTGKTEAALALANHLLKKLYKVNYANIISKYYGDTAKHIVAIFAKAREHDAIPFLDEGDSICSRRLDMSAEGATQVNQNRNTLMGEMDKYCKEVPDLPIIITSNLFVNFDQAMVRRINRAVPFRLPDAPMRRSILDLHFPETAKARFSSDVNLDEIAQFTAGFSGGNLLTMAMAVYETASAEDDRESWRITQDVLHQEAAAVREAIQSQGGAGPARTTRGSLDGYTIPDE